MSLLLQALFFAEVGLEEREREYHASSPRIVHSNGSPCVSASRVLGATVMHAPVGVGWVGAAVSELGQDAGSVRRAWEELLFPSEQGPLRSR